MSDPRPIGVFDSGLGGLTVVREILRMMPGERIIYVGDTARYPYGGRSDDVIKEYGFSGMRFLRSMDIKLAVVACNTVSSVALGYIERHIKDIPLINVVLPGARAAVLRTAEHKIGVVGTGATIRSDAYTKAIHKIDSAIKVYGKECPLFVPLAEEGLFDADVTRLVAQHYLYEMIDLGVDCLILGCTHYPLLMEAIQGTVGTRIQVLDSALWTAKEIQDILTALNALSPEKTGGFDNSRFLVTDIPPGFQQLTQSFLGYSLPEVKVVKLEGLSA